MVNVSRRTGLLLFNGGAIALMCAPVGACTSETRPPPLRLGTTYTVEQSGALALLDSLRPSLPLRIVVGASGQILRSAAAGDLDVVLTHAPSLEQRLLIAPGRAALRCPFVASRFAIVGPRADPARVATAPSAAAAFQRIAVARSAFVSRGDSSGTHVKELDLWTAAGLPPPPGRGDGWYVQAGVDQAGTLRIADERGAYALADVPTFSRFPDLSLRVVFTADSALNNPYTLYVIRSTSAQPPPGGTRFATWALTDWRARLLALRLPGDGAAFAPLPGGCTAPVAGP